MCSQRVSADFRGRTPPLGFSLMRRAERCVDEREGQGKRGRGAERCMDEREGQGKRGRGAERCVDEREGQGSLRCWVNPKTTIFYNCIKSHHRPCSLYRV